MSQLTDNVTQQEAGIIAQALQQIRTQIETLSLIHFQTSAAPINGLADKFRDFHEVVVAAEKKHQEYMVSITPRPNVVVGPHVPSPDAESNISEFHKGDPDPTEER
jgi:hypothetical protein